MLQENIEQTIATLHIYVSLLKQLQQIVIAEGKSSMAIKLMKDISNHDIGMLCMRIPQSWCTDNKYSSLTR